MKGLLKNLGLILILAGVVILLGCSFTGNVNNNAILGTFAKINKKSRKRMFPGFFICSHLKCDY